MTAHILVMNDTQEILELFSALLSEEGYRSGARAATSAPGRAGWLVGLQRGTQHITRVAGREARPAPAEKGVGLARCRLDRPQALQLGLQLGDAAQQVIGVGEWLSAHRCPRYIKHCVVHTALHALSELAFHRSSPYDDPCESTTQGGGP